MNQEELKTLVAQMLRELAPQPEPQVKGSEYRPRRRTGQRIF